MKKLALVLVLAAAAGCSSPGKINADSIDELITDVTARHDAYVKADTGYDDPANAEKFGRRDSDLRSSDLLRKVVAEAKAAKNPPPPAAGTPAK